MIRPPDTAIVGSTLTYGRYSSAEACRRLVHLAFRDAHTALDLTYAHRGFWADPLPPELTITSNNLDAAADADLHVDFTATGLPAGSYDLVIYDPPHVADAGSASIMGQRFGTVKGTAGLRNLIQTGTVEAWRVARIGILVKVADTNHGGELLRLSDWVTAVVPEQPYTVLHTYRPMHLADGKWKAVRVPRSNGAIYLAFRKDGHKHRDFDRLYSRQQARVA